MPKRLFIPLVLMLVFLIGINQVYAQINHYNISKVGARSTMLGGAVVGSVRDNSAIFYNPGGLAFIDNSSVSAAGNFAYLDIIDIKNGAGDNIDLNSFTASMAPAVVSGIIKDDKRPWLTANYALLNNGLTTVNLGAKSEGISDVLPINPGVESFSSTYTYYDKTRDDWLGLSRGYKIGENGGLGATLFFNWRTSKNIEQIDVNITDNDPTNSQLLAMHSYSNRLIFTAIGMLFKLGYSHEFKRLKAGITLASPNIPIRFISSGKLNRNATVLIPGTVNTNKKLAVYQEDIYSIYKLPFNLEAGFTYDLNKKHNLYFTASYFAPINKYSILENYEPISVADSSFILGDPNFSNVNMANKQVINVALGYEYRFNPNLTMMYGFRTDFNNIDFSQLDIKIDFQPTYSFWDIYHFAGGVNYENKYLSLDLGLSCAYGRHEDGLQYVSLNTPHASNELLGDVSNTVDVNYVRLGLLFGFTYFFGKK